MNRVASMPELPRRKECSSKAQQPDASQPKPHCASAHLLRGQQQKNKSCELAMPKRQRFVWGIVANLEKYSDVPAVAFEEEPKRALAEQRSVCEALSRPRSSALAEEITAEPVVGLRTVTEQHSYCSRLAMPRAEASNKPTSNTKLPVVSVADQRRSVERLSEAYQAPVTCRVDLAVLDRNLAELRGRRQFPAHGFSVSLTPKSSPRRHSVPAKRPGSARGAGETRRDSPELSELRQVVEELLWVSLLTSRSCPDSGGGKKMAKDMTTRLNGIILDAIVPVLQPIARFVLPSESAIARRLQKEWPELIGSLGLRRTTTCTWDAEDLQRRSVLVRKCRDLLLAKEFTNTLAQRLKKVHPNAVGHLPTATEIFTEVSSEASAKFSPGADDHSTS